MSQLKAFIDQHLCRRRVSSLDRYRDGGKTAEDGCRSCFERDWDRVLFSPTFRRLTGKTQAIPMPDDDHTHTRLAHSVEVASVGRCLGKRAGRVLLQRLSGPNDSKIDGLDSFIFDVAQITANGCLIHDIGNPPFGHSGEKSIGRYFSERLLRTQAPDAPRGPASLDAAQHEELSTFDGNAQGFRRVTKLILGERGGLQLTAATLLASVKYPYSINRALSSGGKPKKYGVFFDDTRVFCDAAKLGNLIVDRDAVGFSCQRHPLSWLVEAADDICNAVMDVEDAFRARMATFEEVKETMGVLAMKNEKYEGAQFESDAHEYVTHARARAIGQLVSECADAFASHLDAILDGSHRAPLVEHAQSHELYKELKDLAKRKLFNDPGVLRRELAGDVAIRKILDAALDTEREQGTVRSEKLRSLLKDHVSGWDREAAYRRYRSITDFVSGCTDEHAHRLATELSP